MSVFGYIFTFFLGIVTLKINGEFCERFFNILAVNGISFWDMRKDGQDFYVTVYKKDILKIKELRKKVGVHISFKKRSGIPFVLKRYRLRAGIVVGIVLFFIMLNFFSSRIWLIKVNGNETISAENIAEVLTDKGVSSGIKKTKIKSDILKQELILAFDNISWASLNVEGSVLNVNIKEFVPPEDNKTPCNIISTSDAIIKKVDVSSGYSLVKIGDTVYTGQLLVSGVTGEKQTVFVHSNGKIIGEVKENIRLTTPIIKKSYINANKIKKQVVADIMGIKFPLYLGKIHGDFIQTRNIKVLKFFGGDLPIKLIINNYDFIKTTEEVIDIETAKANIKNDYENTIKNQGGIDVRFDNENIQLIGEEYVYTATVYKTINIAQKELIDIKTEEK